MFEYCKEDNYLYRFDRETEEAFYWSDAENCWMPCPEKYFDLSIGFYYEPDDPHWIQTYQSVSQEWAEEYVKGRNITNTEKIRPFDLDWEAIYKFLDEDEDEDERKRYLGQCKCLKSGAKYTPPQPKKPSKAQQKKAFREFLKHATKVPRK